ncbi:MAG: hypothetical protein ACKV19_29765 [Verrucomicrobiales bacterium]
MIKLLAPVVLSVALLTGGAPLLLAQDEVPEAEEAAREQEEKLATIKEKLKYFESHVGEWVGSEEYHVIPTDTTLTTTDEWRGSFSLEGTHFEMQGKGVSDDGPTTYKWICTYDTESEIYRAWYFDSDGNQENFEMDWDEAKKVLVWKSSADDDDDRVSTFYMKVEGNEIKGEGATTMAGSDEPLVKHTMTYKKKRIRI